ncbi:ras GTPase-activating-like protein IQGAP1 isoform X2 [Periplaneta americana]|uniref:ras GTPase-activating-like protein IQGAP1 isoform X2 n=1 Tax=Periplaneta americana TaxID=6978 RepID=UPI0037E8EE30
MDIKDECSSGPVNSHINGIHHTAEEMDEIRQKNMAYEYLCHLEEAKKWLEAVLKEELPPTTELEENLRNGVYLAKLGNIIAPELVPKAKIYDVDQKLFMEAGLRFRHTDNINYWLKSLEEISLPITFHPETTDVYDKKNMPRVIYCLHALSTHLFKLGKAPLIQDLFGKVSFTDEEIDAVRLELKKYGIQMPAFKKIGGILANDLEADSAVLHAAIIAINEAIDRKDSSATLETLCNPAARLYNVFPEHAIYYQEILQRAKINKIEETMNRSLKNSYVADVYDQLLTQTEIQDYLSRVNEHVNVALVNSALDNGTWKDLYKTLQNPALKIPVMMTKFAAPLYFEEMKTDKLECGTNLSYQEIVSSVQVLTDIASVTMAVDASDVEETWKALTNPNAHFTGLDPASKMKYLQALVVLRQNKLTDECECPVLTYTDVQECIDIVNNQHEENNILIMALQKLNTAIEEKDLKAMLRALQSPSLKLVDNIAPVDSILYLKLLYKCWTKRQKEGRVLWLEDVQSVVKLAVDEINDAKCVCQSFVKINKIHQDDNQNITIAINNEEIEDNKASYDAKLRNAVKDWKLRKSNGFSCPWIEHSIKSGREVYFNLEDFTYSWKKPVGFQSKLNCIIQNQVEHKPLEKWLIGLQARCRGYLLRRKFGDRLEFFYQHTSDIVKIQSWWRSVSQRRKYLMMLEQQRTICGNSYEQNKVIDLNYYKAQENKLIKVQAYWRGQRVRKAFLSLFHQPHPSFKVVRNFVHHLNFNADDYRRDLQLQNLKGQVVQTIRHNQQLSHQLDAMDVKIGLLVQNRIALQDVVKHGTNLNELTKQHQLTTTNQDEASNGRGLKSLTKEGRKLLDGYQHLFYALQTTPSYLAKLIFCLPLSRTTRFLQTVILTLFNFGSNPREEYLLLKLFKTALEEEIRCKFAKPSDAVTGNPLVLKMVVNYSRQMSSQNCLRDIVGPLIQKVLDDKRVSFETNPVDIFKTWRNQSETETGNTSNLPYSVTEIDALAYDEIQKRLKSSIKRLQAATLMFLHRIVESRHLIPYGMLYMAKVLRNTLTEKFPSVPEKEILKVVGNLIYYNYINSAIVAPDAFDIVTLPPGMTLSANQRRNLASIAKILQFAASKKGFGEESKHLMCLNPFIIECHEKMKAFFRECCEVEELEEHFSMHEFTEATLISRPLMYISLQEICDTHELLLKYEDHIAPDPSDPLHELLEDLRPLPSVGTLLSNSALPKSEVCLTLINKFEVPEHDDQDTNKLFIRTKKLLVSLLPCLQEGNTLHEAVLMKSESQEKLFQQLIQNDKQKNFPFSPSSKQCTSLRDYKLLLRECLTRLELAGLVSHTDGYQSIVSAIAKDICNKRRQREYQWKELQTLKATKESLDEKTKFYEEQINYYNQYIQKCLENLNAGKRSVHILKPSAKHPEKLKSKLTLRYSAAKLHEKGILLEIDSLPTSQFRNVQFEIAPTDHNGVFTICGKFMGVELEKVEIDIQALLQLQFEGAAIMDIFGKAKINVNLLIFLLNRKFYGKK